MAKDTDFGAWWSVELAEEKKHVDSAQAKKDNGGGELWDEYQTPAEGHA
jgi:hypothetical protein